MNAQRRGANSTRRTFMKAAGAGATAVGASALLPGSAAADDDDDDYDGLLVFIYDDSPAEDYSKTYRVHREYDVPGVIGACPGLMEQGTSDWLLPGHAQAMHQDGWEFMSHTLIHRDLGEVAVLDDVEAGETEIPVQSNLAGRFEGDPIVFIDGDREVEATVAGRREGSEEVDEDDDVDEEDLEDEEEADETRYLVLEEGLEEDISSDAVVRYTDEFTSEILEESQAMLESWLSDQGGVVNGYVHTYDRYEGVQNFVPEFYDSNPNAQPGRGGLNPEHDPDPLQLHRAYYQTDAMDDDELLSFLDNVASEPDFGILAAHSHFDSLPEERIEFAIEAALERNIKIVTMQEALHHLGVMEVQDEQIAARMEEDDSEGDDGGDSDEDDDAGADDGGADDEGTDDGEAAADGDSEGFFDRIMAFLRSLFGR